MTARPNFPMNAWYAATWDAELKHELLPRTIANIKMVFYRTEAGEPVALQDACWHRLVPLSMGKLRGDDVQCAYHGIRYNQRGRCTFMPSQETINPSTTGKLRTLADGLIVSCEGMKVQRPRWL